MYRKKNISAALLINLMIACQVFIFCNVKRPVAMKGDAISGYNCCQGILYNKNKNDSGTQIKILYFSTGDITHSSKNALTFLECKGKRLLISEYQLFPSRYKDSCILIYDTLLNDRVIGEFKINTISQPLFKLPCATVESKSKANADIIVYVNNNGIEKCYVCAITEIINHPEFEYFHDVLENPLYFKIPLSKLIRIDKDSLDQRNKLQRILEIIKN